MKNLILTTALILTVSFVFAQQLPVQSQFSNNLYSINPAVAGSLPYNPINMSYKKLWNGFDETPQLAYLSSNVAISEKVGIGGKVYSYTSGPISKTGMEASYAYHFNLGSSTKLSLGLSAFMYQFNLDKNSLSFEDNNEPLLFGSSNNLIVPDAAFGALAYGSNWYGGFSIYQLFNRKISLTNEELEQRQVRHYNIHGGYIYEINPNYILQGDLLLKLSEASDFQAEISAKCFIMQTGWAGLSYQSGNALSVMLGVGKDRFAIGYAYDIALSDIKAQTTGSHEIMLIYTLPQNKWQRRAYIPLGSTSSSM